MSTYNYTDHRNENFVLIMAILIMLVAFSFYANVIANDAEAQTVSGTANTNATAKVKCGQAGTAGVDVNCNGTNNTGANIMNGDTVNGPNTTAGTGANANVTNGATLDNSALGANSTLSTNANAHLGSNVNTANPGASSVGAAGSLGGGAHGLR